MTPSVQNLFDIFTKLSIFFATPRSAIAISGVGGGTGRGGGIGTGQ